LPLPFLRVGIKKNKLQYSKLGHSVGANHNSNNDARKDKQILTTGQHLYVRPGYV